MSLGSNGRKENSSVVCHCKDEPDYYLSMGLTAEAVAKALNVSREDQDEFVFHSHRKAGIAKEGYFKKRHFTYYGWEDVYLNEKGKELTP